MIALALVVFLASLGLNWPALPLNIRLPDLLFIPVVALLAPTLTSRPSLRLAARGESLSAFDGRCIPADGVAPPANTRGILGRRALSAGRLARLGATTDFHHGLLDVLAAIYLAGSLPSLLVTTDLRSSLIELVRHFYVVAIYAAMAVAVQRGHLRSVLAGMAASGVSLAILGVLFAAAYAFYPFDLPSVGEVMKLPYAGPVLRLKALTATPAMLACVLTMAVPFAIAAAIRADRSRQRVIWVGAVALMTAAAVLTFSHVLAGFLVAAVVAAWPVLQDRPAWRRVGVLAAVAVAIICNLSVVASVRQVSLTDTDTGLADRTEYMYAIDQRHLRVGSVRIVYEVMSYFRIKELAWEAFRAHPLTGVGLDRFHEISERAYEGGRLPARYRAIDPHSSMLGRLAETGLVGGLTLALLWAGLVVTGLRAIRDHDRDPWPARAAFAGLLGLIIAGINVDIMNFRFFWAGLGLLRGSGPSLTKTVSAAGARRKT